MEENIKLIALILGSFFIIVAIAKGYISKKAERKLALKRDIAQSDAGGTEESPVKLADPFTAGVKPPVNSKVEENKVDGSYGWD